MWIVAAIIPSIVNPRRSRSRTMTDEPRDPELLAAEVDALRRQVTELRAETAARDQERRTLGARLLGLHAKSPVAIGFSRDGINVGANPAYLRLFGYGS
jgi:PAS domain-containing protein